jgi:hypothetical protein
LGSLLAGALVFLAGEAALAATFSYHTDDLLGIFVNSGIDYIVDLGNTSSLKNGETFTFATPSTWGPTGSGTGAVGGLFTALAVGGTLNAGNTNRTIFYTTDATLSPQPPTFDNPTNTKTVLTYVRKIPSAQFLLDNSGNGWMPGLNLFGAADGQTVFINNPTALAVSSTVGSSYTTVIGKGTNEISGNLPFSTANLGMPPSLPATDVFPLWEATQTSLNTSHTAQFGSLDVFANSSGDGSQVKLVFEVIPEPGTLLLVGLGLTALVRGSRGRGEQRRRVS